MGQSSAPSLEFVEAAKHPRESVEHPFGSIKQCLGEGAFLMRGLKNVRGEFSPTAGADNLGRAISLVGIAAMIAALRACNRSSTSWCGDGEKSPIKGGHGRHLNAAVGSWVNASLVKNPLLAEQPRIGFGTYGTMPTASQTSQASMTSTLK